MNEELGDVEGDTVWQDGLIVELAGSEPRTGHPTNAQVNTMSLGQGCPKYAAISRKRWLIRIR